MLIFQGKVYALYEPLAQTIGDIPAQLQMRYFHGSQSQYGCMTYTINTRQHNLKYNAKEHHEKTLINYMQ